MQIKLVDRSFYVGFMFDFSISFAYLVWFVPYFLNNTSFDCGLTKDIVLLFIFGISFPLISFCLIESQWIYLFNKFRNSFIDIKREEITFWDKDFQMIFLKSEIKKIEIYSEVMCITQLGYSYRLTIGENDKKLTLYDNSKEILQYLESPNLEIIKRKVYFSAFRAK